MRIGLITTSYPRFPGDPAGGFVAEHAMWLARAGHTVDVVCAGDRDRPDGGSARPSRGERAVVRVPARALFYAGGAPEALESGVASVRDALAFSARLAAQVRALSRGWDAVIAHWLVPCATVAAVAPRRARVLAIAHSGDVHLLRRVGGTSAVAALLLARRARLVFVSRAIRDAFLDAISPRWLARRVARGARVCPMGIDAARFRALRRPRSARSPAELLFLGRLVPVKGIDVLLAAVATLPGPVRLVIAGDGPDRRRLEALAACVSHPVVFTGEVGHSGRDELLAAADLAVMPSVPLPNGRAEGMPVTALEVMAAGVPLVTTDAGGLAELPPRSVTRVPSNDPESLANAIQRACTAAPDRDRVEAAAVFAEQHDWSVIGPRLLAALER